MDYGTVDRDYVGRLATIEPADDGPVWMVNFMKYKRRADYGGAGGPDISGREADDRYAPTEVLADIGAEVVYFGDAVGPDGGAHPDWDRMAIVRYPTRRSFVDMQSRRDFQERRVHKDAGMATSIIMGALPSAPVQGEPSSSGVVRFVAFPEGGDPAEPPAPGLRFEVEGTIVGDGRRWATLQVTWPAAPAPVRDDELLPAGAMVVWARSAIDRIRALVGEGAGGTGEAVG